MSTGRGAGKCVGRVSTGRGAGIPWVPAAGKPPCSGVRRYSFGLLSHRHEERARGDRRWAAGGGRSGSPHAAPSGREGAPEGSRKGSCRRERCPGCRGDAELGAGGEDSGGDDHRALPAFESARGRISPHPKSRPFCPRVRPKREADTEGLVFQRALRQRFGRSKRESSVCEGPCSPG